MDKYFFDHLKDDYANKYHGEREDLCIKLDQDVFGESSAASPEQDVATQSVKDDSSNIPMTMRNCLSGCVIDSSTCQENSLELATTKLSTTLDEVAVDSKAADIASSEKSGTPSQQAAKYEATMRLLGKPLCNWQFEKCYLMHWPPMCCEFIDGCKTLHTPGAPFNGPGHLDRMLVTWSLLVDFAKSIAWATTVMSCQIRPAI